MKPPFDLLSRVVGFENGELDEPDLIELFQYLVNSGLASMLPGVYGRTAMDLIAAGKVDPGHGQNVEAN